MRGNDGAAYYAKPYYKADGSLRYCRWVKVKM